MRRLAVCLVALLLLSLTIPPTAAADPAPEEPTGILQAITDWFTAIIFGSSDPATETPTDDPFAAAGTQSDAPGTDLTLSPTPAPTPGENETITPTPTPTPRTLGTVYAVDYHTAPPYGSAPMMIRFTVADPDEGETVQWDFGDGHSSTEYDHWHTYESAGTYTATLTRGDNQIATLTVQVEPPGVVPLPENEEMMF